MTDGPRRPHRYAGLPGYDILPDGRWRWAPPPGFRFQPYKKLTKRRREQLGARVRLELRERYERLKAADPT